MRPDIFPEELHIRVLLADKWGWDVFLTSVEKRVNYLIGATDVVPIVQSSCLQYEFTEANILILNESSFEQYEDSDCSSPKKIQGRGAGSAGRRISESRYNI